MITRIRRVDASNDVIASCLIWMQKETLPLDEPRNPDEGAWWIAYQNGNAIGFCALSVTRCGSAYLARAGVLRHARGHGLQKRLIAVRLRHAKSMGIDMAITDTTQNPASANSLIGAGFKTFLPSKPWAFEGSIYWFKNLTPLSDT